jgi:endonuclease YncB( thermonuclease family)
MNILIPAAVAVTVITGIPSAIIDGDTLEINHQRVRLFGVDAPELSESYGLKARNHLAMMVGGVPVRCSPTGETTYTRVVARCYLPDNREVNRLMVESGLALDCHHYSHGLYSQDEQPWARKHLTNKEYCR